MYLDINTLLLKVITDFLFLLQPAIDQVRQQRLESVLTICCNPRIKETERGLWSYFILVIKAAIILFHPSEFMFYFAATWPVLSVSIVLTSAFIHTP